MSLKDLAIKYGTDKIDSNHTYNNISYIDIYDKYMKDRRNTVKKFLEIGVRDGQSVKMWKDYFPNAIIYGIDIDPSCKKYEDDRIKIMIGDQNDDSFLKKIKKEVGEIDILLDDGSHINDHQIKTFNYLYPLVSKNGLFIIEDLANSYEEWGNNSRNLREIWPGMKYNKNGDELKNYRSSFNDFLFDKIKNIDLNNMGNNKYPNLLSIHFYSMIAIFENYNV